MPVIHLTDEQKSRILSILDDVPMFRMLKPEFREKVVDAAEAQTIDKNEPIVIEGQEADSFYLIAEGHAEVFSGAGEQKTRLTQMGTTSTFGEIGLLLNEKRSATIVAATEMLVLRFSRDVFQSLFKQIPSFGHAVASGMARRLISVSQQLDMPDYSGGEIDDSLPGRLLPVPFIQRHRLMVLKMAEKKMTVGFVDDPKPEVINAIHNYVPGIDINSVRIGKDYFDQVMRTRLGTGPEKKPSITATPKDKEYGCELDPLLERGLAEGISDLHLTAGRTPGWRIDGDIHPLHDARVYEPDQLFNIFKPFMEARHLKEFEEHGDTDFGYALGGHARFRVSLFRDMNGVNASMRLIPSHVMSPEQLGLPKVVDRFCGLPSGLVVVTGPTGSGKSTTLASMINIINSNRPHHIITLEDPIEFIHENKRGMVNQREIGGHAANFARAIRSGLREDPDVILVGETRDLETLSMVLEVANTGHLVFATLHTNSVLSTVNRIVDLYPAEAHPQVRNTLASVLQGVICQTLCKRIGGGRVAAFEVLMMNRAIANLVREGKTQQIVNAIQSGGREGHLLLNESLHKLVKDKQIEMEEALSKAYDRTGIESRLGIKRP